MSQPNRNAPPPIEEMAGHVGFEFFRLDFAAHHQLFWGNGELGGLVREAFLIHFRNTLMFLYGQRKYNDAIAGDYLDNASTWQRNTPTWYEEDRERCNKLLAHLTYDRVRYKQSNRMAWEDLLRKAAYIESEWQSFLSALPAGRKEWFTYKPQNP